MTKKAPDQTHRGEGDRKEVVMLKQPKVEVSFNTGTRDTGCRLSIFNGEPVAGIQIHMVQVQLVELRAMPGLGTGMEV